MMAGEPARFAMLRGRLEHDAPLAPHTSWRAGGHADRLYVPADRDDLAAFMHTLPPEEPVTALGLGSVWVGAFDDASVKHILKAQADWRPVALLPIGYPAESPSATPRRALTALARDADAGAAN